MVHLRDAILKTVVDEAAELEVNAHHFIYTDHTVGAVQRLGEIDLPKDEAYAQLIREGYTLPDTPDSLTYDPVLGLEFRKDHCSFCLTGKWHGFFPRNLIRH